MSTGEKIRMLRVQLKLSQESFAELVHVSRQTISKWENDICLPNVQNLLVICKMANVPINEFFQDEINTSCVPENCML